MDSFKDLMKKIFFSHKQEIHRKSTKGAVLDLPVVDRETSTIIDKEDFAELLFMDEQLKLKQKAAEDGFLEKITEKIDNSGFPYDYQKLNLPKDNDGFVQDFSVDQVDEIQAFFEKYGFVVVRQVLTEKECNKSIDEIWEFLQRRYKTIERDDPRTWNKWPSLAELGILGNFSILSPQFF